MNTDIPAYLRKQPLPSAPPAWLKELNDQLDDIDDNIGALEQRMVRIETRLVTLMGHMGMNVPPARERSTT